MFSYLHNKQYPDPQALSKDKEGALCYVEGYMVRALREKITRLDPLKEEMILSKIK